MAALSRYRRRAFTLLELVIALAIVGIIAASLYAAMSVGFRAASSSQAAIEPSRTVELTMEYIRNDLENALAPTGVLAGTFTGTQGQDNHGREDDDMVFFSTADAPQHVDANGEIKQIELTVVTPPGGNDHLLIRRVTRNLLARTTAQPDEEVLCRGVTGWGLRFFDGSNWQTTWDSTQQDNTLPTAVEVTLQLDRPAGAPDARTLTFVRVFSLPCSTAAQDPAVNSGLAIP